MGIREFTKSGKFVAIVFVMVVVTLPFGIEEIGETTTLFSFPTKKKINSFFSSSRRSKVAGASISIKAVDWGRYKRDLEDFNEWAERCSVARISLPDEPLIIRVVEEVLKPKRRMWPMPVAACTTADLAVGRKGYVYVSGFDRHFEEGEIIAPSEELCGYEIIFVGERTVWFRAVFDAEGDVPMGVVKLPEFTRVDGECLVRGKRKYYARDAFPLSSGGWLMIDSFMPPGAVVFKILDETRRPVATLLCVVIGEKGGRR